MTNDARGRANFSEKFAALEEAIFSGRAPPDISDDTSPEERQRLREASAILQLLELDRRITSGGSGPVLAEPILEYVPQTLGGFQLERELGRGGYGIVYLARDPRLKRHVAIKTPLPNALLSLDLRRRFLREARAAADLDHPHLLPIYEVGEAGPHCYLVSRYCPVGSLADYLKQTIGPVPIRAGLELVAKIADAVGYMHGRGLLHRDIKPSNILLEGKAKRNDEPEADPLADLSTLHPRLSDFGLVKAFGNADQAVLSASLGSHGMLGTPAYMAPEQAHNNGKDVGPPADVYSLGALLYELLTGQAPFLGTNIVEILEQVMAQDPKAPRAIRAAIPRDLETICLKCLAKRPEDRYAGADQLGADLRRVLAGEPIQGRRPSLLRRAWRAVRRKPLVPVSAALTTALFFSVVGFAVLIAIRDQTERRRIRLEEYTRTIHQVDEGLRTGKLVGINELLNKLRPRPGEDDLRGFEWSYLWQEMWNLGPVWQVGRAASFRYSHNGQMLASGGFQAIHFWDPGTGQRLQSLPFDGECRLVAFSLNDKYLICVGINSNIKTVRILDVGSGKPVWSKDLGSLEPCAARVAQDDHTIIVVNPHEVSLFDRHDATGQSDCLYKPVAPEPILTGAISEDGNLIAVATNRELTWWDRHSKRLQGSQKIANVLRPSIAISPDNRLIAFSNKPEVSILSAHDGRTIRTFAFDRDDSSSLEFSPDNRQLRVIAQVWGAKSKGEAAIWNIANGESLLHFVEPSIRDATFGPSANILSVETDFGSQPVIRFKRLGTRLQQALLPANHVETWAVAFDSGSQLLASAGDDGSVRLWNLQASKLTRRLNHDSLVGAIAFSPDGKTLATGCDDSRLRFWNLASGDLLGEFSDLNRPARFLAYSPDGRLLAVGERSETIVVLDAERRQELFRLTTKRDQVRGLCFSPNSTVLYSGDDDGFLSIWSVRQQKLKDQFLTHSRIRRICCSPSGVLIATAHADGTVVLRDSNSGAELRRLRGHQEQVLAVAFDLNGKTLASAGSDHSVLLWRCEDGQQLIRLTGPVLQVNDLAFSADGRTLAAACHDGNVYLWRGAADDSRPPAFERIDTAQVSFVGFTSHQDVLLPTAPVCLAMGNLGNTGREKLVAFCPESRRLFEVTPGSPPSPKAIPSRALPPNSAAFTLGDFNKNGDVDLIVADPERLGIDVHWSRGEHAFNRVDSLGDGQVHGFLLSADLNNDSQLDLLAANPTTNSLSVYLSLHSDRLDPVARVATGKRPWHISTADLNKDGNLDLIVAGAEENAVSVHLGKGDGTFFAHTNLGDLKRPVATAIGDFNNDGKPDIAVVQEQGDSVAIFLNKDAGQFTRSQDLFVGKGCCSIVASDLNDDSNADLAVVNSTNSNLSILCGRGDGKFDPAKHYPTGKGPTSLLALDFDQDGIQDLAVCCKEGKCVAIHYGKARK